MFCFMAKSTQLRLDQDQSGKHMDNTRLIYPFSPPDSRPFVQTNAFFESRLQVIRPGSSLRLECSATGAPAPNLKWFLDDRLLKAVSLLVSSLGMPAVSLLRLDFDILALGQVIFVLANKFGPFKVLPMHK